jgi:23S rRNA (cytidine1920-2'-O)/16S rRNA (cytidine1409-2'-O)-methyltransferase
MARKGQARLRRLVDVVARAHPDLEDPAEPILVRRVWVDRRLVHNPASLVRADAAIRVDPGAALRGESKLAAALERFDVTVSGRVALDLGAAAGGFTRVLLRAGAARVYAVDVGYGQLLGSLRQDARVVNLERTNVSGLDRRLVPDEIGIVTADLSYLPLARGVAQLNGRVGIAHDAGLIGLVKPQFELLRSRPPSAAADLRAAVDASRTGIEAAGWGVRGTHESPVRGSRGAIEFLLYAVRAAGRT